MNRATCFLSLLALVASSPALACTDFSGFYVDQSAPIFTVDVTQTGCDSMKGVYTTYEEGELWYRNMIFDDVLRDTESGYDSREAFKIDGASVSTRGDIRWYGELYQTSGYIFLTPGGDLGESRKWIDKDGTVVVDATRVYTRQRRP